MHTPDLSQAHIYAHTDLLWQHPFFENMAPNSEILRIAGQAKKLKQALQIMDEM